MTERDRDNARVWEFIVTDDGKRFAAVRAMCSGPDDPGTEASEAQLERFAGNRFAADDRYGLLLRHAESLDGPIPLRG